MLMQKTHEPADSKPTTTFGNSPQVKESKFMNSNKVSDGEEVEYLPDPVSVHLKRQMDDKFGIWGWSPKDDDQMFSVYKNKLRQLCTMMRHVHPLKIESEAKILVRSILNPLLHHECTKHLRMMAAGHICHCVCSHLSCAITKVDECAARYDAWVTALASELATDRQLIIKAELEMAHDHVFTLQISREQDHKVDE